MPPPARGCLPQGGGGRGTQWQPDYRSLVSEDFFKSEHLDLAETLEEIHVKILDITKDTIMIGPSLNPFILGSFHVFQSKCRNNLEDLLCKRFGESELPICKISVKDIFTCSTLSADACYKSLLGDLERSLGLRHLVDDFVKGFDCSLHLVVLSGDEGEVPI